MLQSIDADHDVCTISGLGEHIECNKGNCIQNMTNTNHLHKTTLLDESSCSVKCSTLQESEKILRDIQADTTLNSTAIESHPAHLNEGIRVLLCGDTLGRLNHLKQAIESANKKQGPFHFVLCCGSFFSNSDTLNGNIRSFSFKDSNLQVSVTEEEYKFLTGEEQFSLNIYFIDSSMSDIGDALRTRKSNNYSFSPTLTYLGNYGCTKLHSLTIAHLSGLYNVAHFFKDTKDFESSNEITTFDKKDETSPCDTALSVTHFSGKNSIYYNRAALEKFKNLCYQNAANCDIFISCEWPSGVDQNLSKAQQEDLQQFIQLGETQPGLYKSTSPVVSEIVEILEPRYHIAGGHGIFYQRIPFKTTSHGLVSKFISLASVSPSLTSNAIIKQFKFFHALLLRPLESMNAQSIRATTAEWTPSPYGSLHIAARNKDISALTTSLSPSSQESPSTMESNKNFCYSGSLKRQRCKSENTVGETESSTLSRCVYVSSIPYEVDFDSFIEIMQSFGTIINVSMPKTCSGKSNGRAWITYSTFKEAENAVAAHEQLQSGGRLLRIQYSNENDLRTNKKRNCGTGVGQTPQAIDVRPHKGCWFCLSNPDSEKRLIVSLGEKVYVALAKGGLVSDHVLIIPVTHFPNYLFCPPDISLELENFVQVLRQCFKAQNRDVIVYERYFPMKVTTGMHMQFQVIPIPETLSKKSSQALLKRAKKAGVKLHQLNEKESLKDLCHYVKNSVVSPYFYVEIPGVTDLTIERWIYTDSARSPGDDKVLPFNFGREFVADLLEKPERSNWKSCIEDVTKENHAVEKLNTLFASFQLISNNNFP
ncbi:uncharacterized protein LOC128883986 isoform X2 [Hylaeus volcanicus]|uniref:uncharacterized protein LOC128883986 isoform X2 n=1 Tax=Hylaeus volcanicus TaxID=313075 RepID=UPI0023B81822|nr:uncharacterized protein LOC128883986 isoform X2 [Hylaeus volcanicus]